MPQLPTLTSYVEQWTSAFGALPRSAPIPRRLVEQAMVLGRELTGEPATSVVHGNLD
jgi:streptomycin 6-kinase